MDPHGSILAQPESLNTPDKIYKIEGIGQSCLPSVLDRTLIDGWVKTEDEESFIYAKRLSKEEAMLAGGSSGTAILGAIRYLKENGLQDNPDLR